MQKTDNILEIYYDGVHQRLNAEIDHITRVIGHTGEIGRANEELLVDLITKFLPKQYGIGSGIIIDSEGNRSNQVDIILYDSQRHPEMFAQSSTYLFPVDVVYMTIEVKTTMNTQHMKHALDNIASVKQLKYIKSAFTHPIPPRTTK